MSNYTICEISKLYFDSNDDAEVVTLGVNATNMLLQEVNNNNVWNNDAATLCFYLLAYIIDKNDRCDRSMFLLILSFPLNLT